jgi:hypothetical protein
MGLILRFGLHADPLDVADNRLTPFLDVDVFDRDFLLTFAAMAVQCLQQRGVGAGDSFVRLVFSLCGPQSSAQQSSRAGSILSGIEISWLT